MKPSLDDSVVPDTEQVISNIAVEYVRSGFALVPIPPRSQGPATQGWNEREKCIDDPDTAGCHDGNIGLAHAYSDPPTTALDVDDIDQGRIWLSERGIDLDELRDSPDAVIITSGRSNRTKLIYRLKEPLPTKQITLNGVMVLEFRCATKEGKTMQDVLPPSIHPKTGNPYEWVGDWRNLPEIPKKLLDVWRSELDAQPRREGGNGEIHDYQDTDIERIRDALGFIDPDVSYSDWIKIGMALQSVGLGDLWDHWSMKGAKYKEGDCAYHLSTFDADKGIGIGTLFHIARQCGWRTKSEAPPKSVDKPHSGEPKKFDTTDVGNADRLAHEYRDVLMYTDAGGWLHYDGRQWNRDKKGVFALRYAEKSVRDGYNELKDLPQEERDTKYTHLKKSHSQRSLEAMVKIARSKMYGVYTDFDANPYLLNVQNGTLDLRDQSFREHNPMDKCSRISNVVYDPAATCPRWNQFVQEITGNDQCLAAYLQRAVGYSLTGDSREQCVFFCHGSGSNGKSVFLEVLQSLIGQYAINSRIEAFTVKSNSGVPNDIARLAGARFVTVSETNEGQKLNESLIKDATGGDKMTGRFLWQELFDFYPQFKLWMRGNHKPVIVGTDDGIWRRVHLVPFTVSFPKSRQDANLIETLRAEELPGILNWALEGLRSWLDDGLQPPPVVREATEEYRSDMDILGQFLEECCAFDPSERVRANVVHARYNQWAEESGNEKLSMRKFGDRIKARGFRTETSNGVHYCGLKLR